MSIWPLERCIYSWGTEVEALLPLADTGFSHIVIFLRCWWEPTSERLTCFVCLQSLFLIFFFLVPSILAGVLMWFLKSDHKYPTGFQVMYFFWFIIYLLFILLFIYITLNRPWAPMFLISSLSSSDRISLPHFRVTVFMESGKPWPLLQI